MYTTDEKVKDFGDVPSDTGSTEIKQYIKTVSRFMDKEVGYKIGWLEADGTRTLRYDATGTDAVDLGSNPVCGYSEIRENDIDITSDILAYPLNEDYTNQIVYNGQNFCNEPGAVTITDAKRGAYVVDWKEPDHTLPEDLEHACTVLVYSIIKLKKNGGNQVSGKISSEKTSQYAVTFAPGVEGELGADEISAMKILENYKDHFVA
jgi:hypothetical protein